jgi:hypothetical protein
LLPIHAWQINSFQVKIRSVYQTLIWDIQKFFCASKGQLFHALSSSMSRHSANTHCYSNLLWDSMMSSYLLKKYKEYIPQVAIHWRAILKLKVVLHNSNSPVYKVCVDSVLILPCIMLYVCICHVHGICLIHKIIC